MPGRVQEVELPMPEKSVGMALLNSKLESGMRFCADGEQKTKSKMIIESIALKTP